MFALRVPRQGEDTPFLPVQAPHELEALSSDVIETHLSILIASSKDVSLGVGHQTPHRTARTVEGESRTKSLKIPLYDVTWQCVCVSEYNNSSVDARLVIM